MSEPYPAAITQNLWVFGSAAYPVYLFREGSEAILFEGGIGSTAPLLVEQMGRAGMSLDEVRDLVITHAHPDHVMAVAALRKSIPGLQVVASEAAARTLAMEKALGFFAQMDKTLVTALIERGNVPSEHAPPLAEAAPIAVDRVVKEGDEIGVGASRFQVLQTPGHSECSLSFYEPVQKILIISDATGYYMPADGTWWPNYFTDYGAYVSSIERLATLEAEHLCLSHNAVIRGAEAVRAYFAGALAATRQYHERILAAAEAGTPTRQIAEQLGGEIHAKVGLMPLDFFQKNCGILVKLSLKAAGVT